VSAAKSGIEPVDMAPPTVCFVALNLGYALRRRAAPSNLGFDTDIAEGLVERSQKVQPVD